MDHFVLNNLPFSTWNAQHNAQHIAQSYIEANLQEKDYLEIHAKRLLLINLGFSALIFFYILFI